MVYIVSGPMNSGKTTRLMRVFRDLVGQSEGKLDYSLLDNTIDGFISVKEMDGDLVRGYKSHQLATGYEMDLVIRDTYLMADESVKTQLGPYCFLTKTCKWIDACIKDLIGFKAKAIFIDEVGQLEINGECYEKSIRKVLNAKIDLYMAVRDDLVDDVIEHFNIKKYKIIENL